MCNKNSNNKNAHERFECSPIAIPIKLCCLLPHKQTIRKDSTLTTDDVLKVSWSDTRTIIFVTRSVMLCGNTSIDAGVNCVKLLEGQTWLSHLWPQLNLHPRVRLNILHIPSYTFIYFHIPWYTPKYLHISQHILQHTLIKAFFGNKTYTEKKWS